jgi:hypothetical protein
LNTYRIWIIQLGNRSFDLKTAGALIAFEIVNWHASLSQQNGIIGVKEKYIELLDIFKIESSAPY